MADFGGLAVSVIVLVLIGLLTLFIFFEVLGYTPQPASTGAVAK